VRSKADMSQLNLRMETTSVKQKTKQQKTDMLRSNGNSKSMGNHVVSPEEEKESCSRKDLQKRKVLSLE